MILARFNRQIPKQWHHNPTIKNKYGQTVEDIMKQQGIQVPKEWKVKKENKTKQTQKTENNNQQDIQLMQKVNQLENENQQLKQQIQEIKQIILQQQQQHQQQIQEINQLKQEIQDLKDQQLTQQNNQIQQIQQETQQQIQQIQQEQQQQFQQLYQQIKTQNIQNNNQNNFNTTQKSNQSQLYKNENGQTIAMIQASQYRIPQQEFNHNPELQDNDGNSVAMILSEHGIVPPQQWIHDKMICNYNGQTVQHLLRQNNLNIPDEWQYDDSDNKTMAMIQAQQGKIPDKQYQHQPELQDKYGKTVAIYLSQLGIIPNQQWQHDVNIKDKDDHTVCYYLFNNDISVPEQWQDKQYNSPQKINNQTNAMRNAINNKIPDNNDYHDPNIEDNSNHTVVYYLQQSNLPVPNRWYDESMKDKQKNTDFIEQTIYGQIPVKSDNIQSDYQNCQGWTVAMILARFNKEIPNEWKHDKSLRNINDDTITMIYAKYGHIPPQEWNHQSDLYNKDGDTVAMLLAKNKIIPPREWLHHPTIQNLQGQTVGQILQKNNLPIPNEWYDQSMRDKQKNPEFIQQAIYREIPKKPDNINFDYQNIDGWTVAMILAKLGKQIPQEWEHDPDIQNKYKDTVAMLLAQNGIIPPEQWIHDKYIGNQYGETVYSLLKNNNIDVPECWNYGDELYEYYEKYNIKYNKLITPEFNNNKDKMTYAIFLASKGIVPSSQWYHDKYLTDNKGKTVQHYLEVNDIQVPKEWSLYIEGYENESYHKNENGQTSAMILAQKGIIPSKKMWHHADLKDIEGHTVCYYLWDNGVMVPEKWQDYQYKNPYKRSDSYQRNGYYYYNTTNAMENAINGYIPNKDNYHNPNITDRDGHTVQYFLQQRNLEVPPQWKTH